MLLVTYHALNYAGIIGLGLKAKHDYESNLINTYAISNNSLIFKYISTLTHNNSIPEVMMEQLFGL